MVSDGPDRQTPPSAWRYSPASDLGQDLSQRLMGFPREPHLWMYVMRSAIALILRGWLRLYHRFALFGREHLPLGQSFVMVANHQSRLDALCLAAGVPLRQLHRVFPAAAADYFFENLPKGAFSALVLNALPFDRTAEGAESLDICRALLGGKGNILILFPEGTRSATGEMNRFRSGIGRLVAGTRIPVVPCYLTGAFPAFPKGSAFPRPYKVTLRIGAPQTFADLPPTREGVQHICNALAISVRALGQSGHAVR